MNALENSWVADSVIFLIKKNFSWTQLTLFDREFLKNCSSMWCPGTYNLMHVYFKVLTLLVYENME